MTGPTLRRRNVRVEVNNEKEGEEELELEVEEEIVLLAGPRLSFAPDLARALLASRPLPRIIPARASEMKMSKMSKIGKLCRTEGIG